MHARRPSQAVLTRAARVADATGRVIEIVAPDGMMFRIAPKGATIPATAPCDPVEAWFAGGKDDAC